jgi:hypothetical protein
MFAKCSLRPAISVKHAMAFGGGVSPVRADGLAKVFTSYVKPLAAIADWLRLRGSTQSVRVVAAELGSPRGLGWDNDAIHTASSSGTR